MTVNKPRVAIGLLFLAVVSIVIACDVDIKEPPEISSHLSNPLSAAVS